MVLGFLTSDETVCGKPNQDLDSLRTPGTGKITLAIDRAVPLSESTAAMRHLNEDRAAGEVVIAVN